MTSTSTSFSIQHHRSTRAEILSRDVDVQNLVEELSKAQRRNWDILANCIERCHSASIARSAWRTSPETSWRTADQYRCKTLACPSCGTSMWRKAVRTTLDRFYDVDVADLSLVTITGFYATNMDAMRVEVRKLRRSLRDLRDAQAEKRTSWRTVRIAGLVDVMPIREDGPFLVLPVTRLLMHHAGVLRSSVERVLREWFSGSGRDVHVTPYRRDAFMGPLPGAGLPMPWRAAVVAALFVWHRGTEPLRVAVGPQRCSRSGAYPMSRHVSDGRRASTFREPMPIVF